MRSYNRVLEERMQSSREANQSKFWPIVARVINDQPIVAKTEWRISA
jgi:hypothetical protein